MLGIQIFMATCDLASASLGICGCAGSVSNEVEFQICATEKITSSQTSGASAKPQRLCRYYTNGTIDIPTLTVIEAYVDVGSRMCIGDELKTSSATVKTITDELEDQLSAKSGVVAASYEPAEVEIDQLANFSAWFENKVVTGVLLGREAEIRFQVQSYRWTFSDGEKLFGRKVEKAFESPGNHSARAFARISVDYRLAGESWVVDAYRGEIPSNSLEIGVIERPRRTLLVDP